MVPATDARLFFPATARNREPILEVLTRVLPHLGTVVEIGSGSGEHVAYFARRLPSLRFQPTDPLEAHRASIDAWVESEALTNVAPALVLDAEAEPWPLTHADAVFTANVIHIAPWSVCLAILAGAGAILPPGAPLIFYGPFRRDGAHTAESNAAFDESLRSRDPRWGVRDLEDVTAEAAARGFELEETVPMPANNFTVIYRRR